MSKLEWIHIDDFLILSDNKLSKTDIKIKREKEEMRLYDFICTNMDGTEELLSGSHCSKISMMNGEAVENIYLLILHHFTKNNTGYKQTLMEGRELPYSSKLASKDGKGLTFRVSLLPDEIQRIIVRYLRIVSV